MLAAMMVHGVSPGPFLIRERPELFWGFIASMYVGNIVLLVLNLPLVGVFVNLLRLPYPVLYPTILVFCILGVYAVNGSVVDVWIMLVTGALGYVLRKLDFETAPIVLGVVLAPMLEMALRQSLAMSDGHYGIFVTRPIAGALLAVGGVLVLASLRPLITRSLDWRARLTLAEEGVAVGAARPGEPVIQPPASRGQSTKEERL
jgi:putative tricarboxylic transport membrane protein